MTNHLPQDVRRKVAEQEAAEHDVQPHYEADRVADNRGNEPDDGLYPDVERGREVLQERKRDRARERVERERGGPDMVVERLRLDIVPSCVSGRVSESGRWEEKRKTDGCGRARRKSACTRTHAAARPSQKPMIPSQKA
jgi:hypothetical protein